MKNNLNLLAGIVMGLFLLVIGNSAFAAFVTFNGDTTVESSWQTAAGGVALEDFESYSAGTQISSLPALGISFSQLAGGGYPFAYYWGVNDTTHGPMHLGNFPNGINAINQWDSIILNVLPGMRITALGFWNGDGQADTLVAEIYDSSGNLLGSVGSYKDTFAGFVSDIPISRVVFNGNTGDGWNHLDGLQTNAASVPIPGAVWLLSSGLVGLIGVRKNKKEIPRGVV